MHPRRPPLALVVLLLGLAGCAASPSLVAARAGDAAALRAAIASEARRGALDDDAARELAQALAGGIVARAEGLTGLDEVRAVASCARSLDRALEARSRKMDEVGAAAALLRIEAELDDPDAYVERATTGASDPYRAVGARGLVTAKDGALRRALMLDGDETVRRAALRAAIDAGDPSDGAAVLEAARLDPSEPARLLAIRAAAAVGGDAVVLALRDRWATAAEVEREAIVQAWAARRALDVGGREQLRWALGQAGTPALLAASALMRADNADRADAMGVLLRAIEGGVSRERVLAIARAPLGADPVRAALEGAERDADEAVAAAALARRLSSGALAPSPRAVVIARLLELAGGASPQAVIAKGALAHAQAREAIPLLERETRAAEARVRSLAAVSLTLLGEPHRAAPLLADTDAKVRLTVACAILRAP